MGGSFCSYDIVRRIRRSMLKMKLMVLLLCDILKHLLKKIIYYPESFFRHSNDDQQNKDDNDLHQPEVMNFGAPPTSAPTYWFHLPVPVVVPLVIDTELIEKQLPVVQYRDLILKKSNSQRQYQTTSLSSRSEEETHISSCIVCMNNMEGSDEVRELCNCEHVFHKNCLDAWIGQAQLTCPLCRSELLIPVTTSSTIVKLDNDGGGDPWRVERMTYLFGQDMCFTS